MPSPAYRYPSRLFTAQDLNLSQWLFPSGFLGRHQIGMRLTATQLICGYYRSRRGHMSIRTRPLMGTFVKKPYTALLKSHVSLAGPSPTVAWLNLSGSCPIDSHCLNSQMRAARFGSRSPSAHGRYGTYISAVVTSHLAMSTDIPYREVNHNGIT